MSETSAFQGVECAFAPWIGSKIRSESDKQRCVSALEAWARSAWWTPPGAIDVEALCWEMTASVRIVTAACSDPMADDLRERFSGQLREALGPAAKRLEEEPEADPAKPRGAEEILRNVQAFASAVREFNDRLDGDPPATPFEGADEQSQSSREELDLIERAFVASWPLWLQREVESPTLTIAEARAGCWYEAEQAVRARPAHLDPEAARDVPPAPQEKPRKASWPFAGVVIDTKSDGRKVVTVDGERHVPARVVEEVLEKLEAEGRALVFRGNETLAIAVTTHGIGTLSACDRIRKALAEATS